MSEIAAPPNAESAPPRTFLARLKDSDLLASFLSSKVTVAAGVVTLVLFLAALFAPWIAPTDPFNPATNFLSDSLDPPSFVTGGDPRFLLGADDQGRDLWSAILYGLRVSLAIGFCGVALGGAIGITLGLVSGYAGGWIDAVIMRIADVQLTFPAILIALLLDGVAHALLKASNRDESAFAVLVVSIGLSFWVQYARTVRASTMVEKNRDYVLAARLIGLSHARVLVSHILPNVMGPVLVIATTRTPNAVSSRLALFSRAWATPSSSSAIRIAGKVSWTSATRMMTASIQPPA